MDDRIKVTPTHIKIVEFLRLLRASSDVISIIFTNGGCYKLYEMLKLLSPDAEPWYDAVRCHVYTKIGDIYYDIDGYYTTKQIPKYCYQLCIEPNILKEAVTWKCGLSDIASYIKKCSKSQ